MEERNVSRPVEDMWLMNVSGKKYIDIEFSVNGKEMYFLVENEDRTPIKQWFDATYQGLWVSDEEMYGERQEYNENHVKVEQDASTSYIGNFKLSDSKLIIRLIGYKTNRPSFYLIDN